MGPVETSQQYNGNAKTNGHAHRDYQPIAYSTTLSCNYTTTAFGRCNLSANLRRNRLYSWLAICVNFTNALSNPKCNTNCNQLPKSITYPKHLASPRERQTAGRLSARQLCQWLGLYPHE